MKTLNKLDTLNVRPALVTLKHKFGALYGMTAGLAFAISSWGWDGYMLSQAHAYFPWTMLVVGAIFCAALGGMIGWLTARSDNSLLGVLFWVVSSAFFAWLVVALPLQIAPTMDAILDPHLGLLLNYGENVEFASRFDLSLMWVVPFTMIVGAVQLPITESAIFSASIFGRVAPIFFCIVVMGISGAFTADLINARFREAITALDNTIQFAVDNHNNKNVDPALAREARVRALKTVEEYVQESRHLFVGNYDSDFGDIHILVKFGEQWVDCEVLFNQPLSCEPAVEK